MRVHVIHAHPVETSYNRALFDAVCAELTANGAASFGTYETGEAFDPVTVSFATEDCAPAALPMDEDVQTEPTAATSDLGWLLWLILGLVLLAAIVAVVVIVRRRASN